MWKTLLAKIVNSVFVQKLKVWFKKLGFTNVVYLGLAIGTPFVPLGLIGLAFLKAYLVGAFIGIFCYLNWNLIAKLWKTKVQDVIEDKIDDIKG
jgi:hypothetical protein